MDKKVSIIIPVYNVQDYLRKCLDSVLAQTYKNVEIILVNDGSTDESPKICNEYCHNDNRVKIINKSNGGLSSARNYGLNVATGDYISFIDSDDYIDKNMIQNLVDEIKTNNADIACCNYDFCNEESIITSYHKVTKKNNTEIFNREQALSKLLFENYYKCYAWNKLYKATLFQNIRYPEGKLYEDIITTYNLIKKSDKIVFLKNSLYHYRVRSNSITQSKFSSKNYDLIDALKYIIEDKPSIDLKLGTLIYYLYFIDDMISGDFWDENIYQYYKKNIKKMSFKILASRNIKIFRKIQMFFCATIPRLYKNIYLKIS